jgi:hypothetical protein
MPELTDSLLLEVLHAFQHKGLTDWLTRWSNATAPRRREMIHAMRSMP